MNRPNGRCRRTRGSKSHNTPNHSFAFLPLKAAPVLIPGVHLTGGIADGLGALCWCHLLTHSLCEGNQSSGVGFHTRILSNPTLEIGNFRLPVARPPPQTTTPFLTIKCTFGRDRFGLRDNSRLYEPRSPKRIQQYHQLHFKPSHQSQR
jgi:hypothetical protein